MKARGFTLIELLIAMAITVLVSAAAVSGWRAVTQVERRLHAVQQELAHLERAFMTLNRDIGQLTRIAISDELGGERRPLEFSTYNGAEIEFTRGGWFNPAPDLTPPRSDLQRVAYRIEEERLLRRSWFHLDRLVDGEHVDRLLLDSVSALAWRFLDRAGEWHDTWPPSNGDVDGPFPLPIALELSVEHQQLGPLTRLFAVP